MLPPDGKVELRPVKAVVMRWASTGLTVGQILDMDVRALTLPEYAAYKLVKNMYEAVDGTRPAQQAFEAFRMVVDGLEPGQVGPMIPVTYIDRLTESSDGTVQRTKEFQQTVTMTLPSGTEDSNGGQR